MSALRRFMARIANLFFPGRADRALARELRSHVAFLEDEYRRRGLSPEDARRSALQAAGGQRGLLQDFGNAGEAAGLDVLGGDGQHRRVVLDLGLRDQRTGDGDAVEIGGAVVLCEDGSAGEQQAGEDGGGKRVTRDRITLARHV